VELLHFNHMDGRPVSFDRKSVLLFEPHESGAGTFLRAGPVEHPRDMHLAEEYELVETEVTMSSWDRATRSFLAKDESEAEKVPF